MAFFPAVIPTGVITYRITSVIFITDRLIFVMASVITIVPTFIIRTLVDSIGLKINAGAITIVPAGVITIMACLRNGILIIGRVWLIEIIIPLAKSNPEV